MYLAEAKTIEEVEAPSEAAAAATPAGRWQDFPNSHISHHGEACCDIAREWLIAMDFAQLSGGDVLTGPRWIREKQEWGPSAWPITWCQAVGRRIVDCGVHAALAQTAFEARGVRAFRAQFVQRYSNESAEQWRLKWGVEQVSDQWIDGDRIYHEGNAVLVGDEEVKLWDGSAGWWINPRQAAGYGSIAALRITGNADGLSDGVEWGGRRIPLNRWVAV